jgi:hypothetical protein
VTRKRPNNCRMQQWNVARHNDRRIATASKVKHPSQHAHQWATVGNRIARQAESGLRARQLANDNYWAAAEPALKQPCDPLPERGPMPGK